MNLFKQHLPILHITVSALKFQSIQVPNIFKGDEHKTHAQLLAVNH